MDCRPRTIRHLVGRYFTVGSMRVMHERRLRVKQTHVLTELRNTPGRVWLGEFKEQVDLIFKPGSKTLLVVCT